MSPVVLLLLAVYVLLEGVVVTALAAVVGWGWVFVVMAALVVVGVAVMRRAGASAARALYAAGSQPGVPDVAGVRRSVGDASLLFLAGVLIALPGLVTSVVGLLMLIRPVRRLVGVGLLALVGRRVVVTRDLGSGVTVVTGEVVRDDAPGTATGRPDPGEPPALGPSGGPAS